MNTKKGFILVIAEGISDQKALEPILSFLYKPRGYRVEFLRAPYNGRKTIADITTHGNINSRIIFGRINQLLVEPWLNNNHFTPDLICKVIHIVDMDGAYIDDRCIKYDPDRIDPSNPRAEKLKYGREEILSANVEQTKIRNAQKRNNLDWLSKNNKIHYTDKTTGEKYDLDYEIYFFSCNLDHVLHHDANMEPRIKRPKAEEFGSRYGNNPEEFIQAISSSILKNMTYKESWDFITERNNHSLESHTNINILIDGILNGG